MISWIAIKIDLCLMHNNYYELASVYSLAIARDTFN